MNHVKFLENEIDKTYDEFGKNIKQLNNSVLTQRNLEIQLEQNKKQSQMREAKLNQYENTLNATRERLTQRFQILQKKKYDYDIKANKEEFDLNLKYLNLVEKDNLIESRAQILNANIQNVTAQVRELSNLDINIAKRLNILKRTTQIPNNTEVETIFIQAKQLEDDSYHVQESIHNAITKIITMEEDKIKIIKEATKLQQKRIRILEQQKLIQNQYEEFRQQKEQQHVNESNMNNSNNNLSKNNAETNNNCNNLQCLEQDIKELSIEKRHQELINQYKQRELDETEEDYQIMNSRISDELQKIRNKIDETKSTRQKADETKRRVDFLKRKNFHKSIMQFFQNREELNFVKEQLIIPDVSKYEQLLDNVEDEYAEECQKEKILKKEKKDFIRQCKKEIIDYEMTKKSINEELKTINKKITELNDEYNLINERRIGMRFETIESSINKENKGIDESDLTKKEPKSIDLLQIEILEKEVENQQIALHVLHEKENELTMKLDEKMDECAQLLVSPVQKPQLKFTSPKSIFYLKEELESKQKVVNEKKQKVFAKYTFLYNGDITKNIVKLSDKCYLMKFNCGNYYQTQRDFIGLFNLLLDKENQSWKICDKKDIIDQQLNDWNYILDICLSLF